MRCSSPASTIVTLVFLVGCVPPPSEVTTSGTSSGDPPPTTTAATTSPGQDTTTSTSTSAAGSGGSADTSAGASSSGAQDESSTGEPADEPLGPFGAVEAVTELNSVFNEDDPTLTGDLLEIYFASTRLGTEDVWTSTRASTAAPWDAPVAVASLNSVFTETFPEVSADGLFILVASNRADGLDLDVYFSQRAARDLPWPALLPLPGATTAVDDYGVTPSPELASAFLCRVAPEGLGQADIWLADADFSSWAVNDPVLVAELSSNQADCSVSLSPSRREIFFESTRPIGVGYDWNLWRATRDAARGAWSIPVAVDELNGEFDEVDPWLSPDRHTLYFASGTPGSYELYMATRE